MRFSVRNVLQLTFVMATVAAGGQRSLAQSPVPSTPPATLLPSLALPPNVSDWSPRGRVYPGQVLTIRGRGFDPTRFVVHVGSGTPVIALSVASGTSTEIRATVPAQFTAAAGAPLTVRHANGQSRELEANFRILPRDVTFTGPSLWHIADSTTSDVFTRGVVTVQLELLEFAQSGGGSYRETVSLVRFVRTFEEDCTTNVNLPGKRSVDLWDFQSQRPSRRVTWTRLPDRRIEIREAGVDAMTILATISAQGLRANVSTTAAGPFDRLTHDRHLKECRGINMPPLPPFSPTAPPLRGVPIRRVEWSLARSGS